MPAMDMPQQRMRHPWLAALIEAPADEVEALINGYADVAPFARAEPSDAAESLLFGLPPDDEAVIAFDKGCYEMFRRVAREILTSEAPLSAISAGHRLMTAVRRILPQDTIGRLHQERAYWSNVFEAAIVDKYLDLQREYLRLLAVTQHFIEHDRRKLLSLWLEICAESGPNGRFDASYLDVGLLGLRGLPLDPDHSSNEEAVLYGLGRWALRQSPSKTLFLNRWREIGDAYPSQIDYWPRMVREVIETIEDQLGENDPDISFPAAGWWRDELDISRSRRSKAARQTSRHAREIEPPPREDREALLRDMGQPLSQLRNRISQNIAAHCRYAEATGDVYYLVRTASNLGLRLLEQGMEPTERGILAADLARTGLRYAPGNVYLWSLHMRALGAQGALEKAEVVGWEALRRFPEDPQWRTKLATLIADNMDRRGEAVQILREGVSLFADHDHASTQLAMLLAEDGDYPGAIEVLTSFLSHTENPVSRSLLERAVRGQPLRQKPRPITARAVVITLEFDEAPALARRALFRAEHGSEEVRAAALEEIRDLHQSRQEFAYVRYAAEHLGLTPPRSIESSFAFAIDRAIRAGSHEALNLLLASSAGAQAIIVTTAIAALTAQEFSVPKPANDVDDASVLQRLAGLTRYMPSTSAGKVQPDDRYLGVICEFAASTLSLQLAA